MRGMGREFQTQLEIFSQKFTRISTTCESSSAYEGLKKETPMDTKSAPSVFWFSPSTKKKNPASRLSSLSHQSLLREAHDSIIAKSQRKMPEQQQNNMSSKSCLGLSIKLPNHLLPLPSFPFSRTCSPNPPPCQATRPQDRQKPKGSHRGTKMKVLANLSSLSLLLFVSRYYAEITCRSRLADTAPKFKIKLRNNCALLCSVLVSCCFRNEINSCTYR
jgi:hypothetical protein